MYMVGSVAIIIYVARHFIICLFSENQNTSTDKSNTDLPSNSSESVVPISNQAEQFLRRKVPLMMKLAMKKTMKMMMKVKL